MGHKQIETGGSSADVSMPSAASVGAAGAGGSALPVNGLDSIVFKDSSTGQVEAINDAGSLQGSLPGNEVNDLQYDSDISDSDFASVCESVSQNMDLYSLERINGFLYETFVNLLMLFFFFFLMLQNSFSQLPLCIKLLY